MPSGVGLLVVVLLLALNAVFVATEFAFVRVRRSRVEQLARKGHRGAVAMRRMLGNLDYYIAAAQLGITLASIALGFVGEPALAALIEPPVRTVLGALAPAVAHTAATIVAFILINALHIVFGEFTPKSIALQRAEGVALGLAVPIAWFARIANPAVWLLNHTSNFLLRLVGVRVEPISDVPASPESLAYTLETSASAGLISRAEFYVSRSAIRLSYLPAGDLMVPRTELVALPIQASREEVLLTLARHKFTRYPVYDGTLDNIVGVLDVRRILLQAAPGERGVERYLDPPVVIPEALDVEEALDEAQRAGATLMILVDEYGGTAGILSVFDVVEFLAGEFPSEYDVDGEPIRRNADGSLTVSGLLRIDELQQRLEIALPETEAETLGGLIMSLLGRVPRVRDTVSLDGYSASVEAMDGRRVDRVRLVPRRPDATASERGDER